MALFLALSLADAAHAYDAAKWREDFAQARQELARSYANLDWVVTDRKIDLQQILEIRSADRTSADRHSDRQLTRSPDREMFS